MTLSSVTAATASKLANSRLEVTDSTSLGRGLTVTKDVPAGSLLLRLDPLISVLDDSLLDKACSTCFSISKSVDETVGKELLKCTGCNFVHYCSKVPQPLPGILLIVELSEKRLEDTSFERVQISTTQQEYSTGIIKRSDEISQSLRRRRKESHFRGRCWQVTRTYGATGEIRPMGGSETNLRGNKSYHCCRWGSSIISRGHQRNPTTYLQGTHFSEDLG